MKRFLVGSAVVIVLLAAFGGVSLYHQINDVEVSKVGPNVHALHGLGSNVGILRTDIGAVVVDTMTFRSQGVRIRELAEELGGGPIQALINTHYHLDHTHGNPAFPSGTRIVATERTRAYLDAVDADYWSGDAAGTLPGETFRNEHELRIADKTIRLIHPGRGHTDGDLVVLFVEDKVLHTGDLFFNGRYPNIDLEAGGSVIEWVATIDRILELDFDRVIPGHGPVTDREGLREFQRFMRQLAQTSEAVSSNGWSLEDTQAKAELDADAGYEVMSIPLIMRLDREFVLKRAWEEATGNHERIALWRGCIVKDLFSVEGKVALVTGGSRGIGRMIAQGYVENGARVYISARNAEVCEETAAELSKGGTCVALPANLSSQEEAKRLASEIASRESQLDILVNNAGANWGAPIEEYPDDAWDKVLALNVKGVFHLTVALLPQLEAAATPEDPARVINVGSIDGIQVPALETYAYSASKAAVHQLTRVLAKKLAERDITVNAVAPGPFESKMMAATLEAFGDSIAAGCPRKRIGTPEDMAGVAIYLASRAGAYVTGAVIPVDGGIATTR